MPIQLGTPILVSRPVEIVRETPYPSVWITRLEVSSHPVDGTRAVAVFNPWNPQTNDIATGEEFERKLVLDELFVLAMQDPDMGDVIRRLIDTLERKARQRGVIV